MSRQARTRKADARATRVALEASEAMRASSARHADSGIVESFIARARTAISLHASAGEAIADEQLERALMQGQSPGTEHVVFLAVRAARLLEGSDG